jgi:hypothetical protein
MDLSGQAILGSTGGEGACPFSSIINQAGLSSTDPVRHRNAVSGNK